MAPDPKRQQPKGILKKPKSTTAPPPQTKAEAERIALQHARIIQQQKDLQTEIFEAINTLVELPLAQGRPSADPAPADAACFKSLVRLFQPGDYDDLIEERSVAGRCGYALCGRRRRSYAGGGEFRLVNKNRDDFGIVRRGELERWCSDTCARRALYVKVQLNETPAWERVGLPNLDIELLEEEDEGGPEAALERSMRQLELEQSRRAAHNSSTLAVERGDADSTAPTRNIDVTIREKSVTAEPKQPEHGPAEAGEDSHLVLEGHRARFASKKPADHA